MGRRGSAALGAQFLVEQAEIGHALGELKELIVGPRRIQSPELGQQLVDKRAEPPLPHARHHRRAYCSW